MQCGLLSDSITAAQFARCSRKSERISMIVIATDFEAFAATGCSCVVAALVVWARLPL